MNDDAVRRRWQPLTEEQRALADELVERAQRLRDAADGELGVRESIELAADAIQRRQLAGDH